MKKVPDITLDDWLEAEKELVKPQPRPEGYISAAEYSQMRNISPSRARRILYDLYQDGRATRERWMIPYIGGVMYLYKLIK